MEKGVRQGDTIPPNLFTLAQENTFKQLHWKNKGITRDLNHLRFGDDIVIISSNNNELKTMLEGFEKTNCNDNGRHNPSQPY